MILFRSKKDLFQFSFGTKTWYFTSAEKEVIHDEITYKPVKGLQRGDIEDADIDKCETEVTMFQYQILNDAGDDFQQIFNNKIYLETVYLTILELYKGETLVLFKGRVTQPKYDEDANTLTLVCSTAESLQNRNILTRKFQKPCANKIYDMFCSLDFQKWASYAKVSAISGLSVVFSFEPNVVTTEETDVDGNLVTTVMTTNTGYGEIIDNVVYISKKIITEITVTDHETEESTTTTEEEVLWKIAQNNMFARGLLFKDGVYTFITDNSNTNQVWLYRPHIDLAVDDIVLIAPGCDQSLSLCHSRFENSLNHHGFPNIPSTNPVNDTIIK